jgi:hypothetical protein
MSKIKIVIDKSKAESLYNQLTKLQAWHTGWHEAGKIPPPGAEAVWQLRQIIKDGKETN